MSRQEFGIIWIVLQLIKELMGFSTATGRDVIIDILKYMDELGFMESRCETIDL